MPKLPVLTRLTLALVAALAAQGMAHGATRTWVGAPKGANSWTVSSLWSGGVVPVNGDDVLIGSSAAGNPSFNATLAGAGLNSLTLNFGSTLDQSASFTAMVAATETIGNGSSTVSTYNHSRGSNTVGKLILGAGGANGGGVYNLSGGTLAVSREMLLGFRATGTFNQTGGTASVDGDLLMGYERGSTGNYFLKGGTMAVTGEFLVGVFGSGKVVQSGGISTVRRLEVSASNTTESAAGTGSYVLNSNDGTAVLTVTRELIGVPSSSGGSFVQSGNVTHTVTGELQIGSVGVFSLTGGTLNAGSLSVDAGGVFSQHGGSVNTTFTNNGTLNYSAGSFLGALVNGPAASLNLTGVLVAGGAVTNQGVITLVSGAGLGGATLDNQNTITLAGGSLTGGTVTNNGTLNYSAGSFLGSLVNGPSASLNLTGVLVAGGAVTNQGVVTLTKGAGLGGATLDNQNTITLAGGSLTGGTISNNGSISGYGSFTGASTLQNNGQLTQGTGNLVFANTGANVNYSTVSLAAGRQMQVTSGASFTNAGSLALNGALITGAGSLTNSSAGTIAGAGSLTAATFVNRGTLVPGNGTLYIQPAWTNRGLVQLTGPLSSVTGGRINNLQGTIQGVGTVGAFVESNIGTIEAIGGTLVLAGGVVNTSASDGAGGHVGGVLAAGSGAKLLLSLGGDNQAGATIALSGGTFDTNLHSLSNGGQINGWGTVRTAGISNSGQILLAGGASSVFGPVVGAAGSLIALSGNSTAAFYSKLDIQSGAELRVSAGSVATFFGAVAQRTGSTFSGTGTKFYEGGLSVGASPGLGVDAGDVIFGDDNVYLAEIGGAIACTSTCATDDALKNTSFDKYIVAGHLGLGGTLKLASWNGFIAQAGQRFDLLDWGSESGKFMFIDASGLQLAAGTALDTSQLYVNGTLAVVAVPEPTSGALMLAGLGLGLGWARRRQRG